MSILNEINGLLNEYRFISEKTIFDREALEWTTKSLSTISVAEDTLLEEISFEKGLLEEYETRYLGASDKILKKTSSLGDLNKELEVAKKELKRLEAKLTEMDKRNIELIRYINKRVGVYKRRETLIKKHKETLLGDITQKDKKHIKKLIDGLKSRNVETLNEINTLKKKEYDITIEKIGEVKKQADVVYNKNRYISERQAELNVLKAEQEAIRETKDEIAFGEVLRDDALEKIRGLCLKLKEYVDDILGKVQHEIYVLYVIRTKYTPKTEHKDSGAISINGEIAVSYNLKQVYEENEKNITKDAFYRVIHGISLWLHDIINGVVADTVEAKYDDWSEIEKDKYELTENEMVVAIMKDEKKTIEKMLTVVKPADIKRIDATFIWTSSGGREVVRTGSDYEDIKEYIETALEHHIRYAEELQNEHERNQNRLGL